MPSACATRHCFRLLNPAWTHVATTNNPGRRDDARMVTLGVSAVNLLRRLLPPKIKLMRLNPSAGDYGVTIYSEPDLPPYMAGKVGDNAYLGD